jgi:hypothetical protein
MATTKTTKKTTAKKPAAKGAGLAAWRAAKAAGKVPAKKSTTRATTRAPRTPPVEFPAPPDFKPFFAEVKFRTGEDGLLMPKFVVNRIRGRWDNPEAKRFDMLEYDQQTALALVSRLSGRLFAPNQLKRLTANKSFQVVLRVALRRKKNAKGKVISETLGARIVSIGHYVKKKDSTKSILRWFNPREKEADKVNVDRRKIQSANRFLAGSFVNVQLPPSGRKSKGEDE